MPELFVAFSEQERERLTGLMFGIGLELTLEKGYKGIKVDTITQRAGIAKGSFFNFFTSKSDYIVAMLQWYGDQFLEQMHLAAQKPGWDFRKFVMETLLGDGFCFLNPAEQLKIKNAVNETCWAKFKENERAFYCQIVRLLGKDPAICKPEVFANLLVSLLTYIHAPEHVPSFFPDAREDTIKCLADAVCLYVEEH